MFVQICPVGLILFGLLNAPHAAIAEPTPAAAHQSPERLPKLLRLQPLRGPFPSLANYCVSSAARKDGRRRCLKEENPAIPLALTEQPTSPYRSIQVLRQKELGLTFVSIGYSLALEVPGGVYVAEDIAPAEVHQAAHDEQGWIRGIAPVPQADGPPLLSVAVTQRQSFHGDPQHKKGPVYEADLRMFCCLGETGVPRCTRPLLLGCKQGGSLPLRLLSDGTLQVDPVTNKARTRIIDACTVTGDDKDLLPAGSYLLRCTSAVASRSRATQ